MNLDSRNKLSHKTIILHWSVAITMIALVASGIYMSENEIYALYDIHKSIGVLILLLVVWRIVWRIKNGWPKAVGDYSQLEKITAKAVHYLLLLGTVLLPLSGFAMSALGGYGVSVFGLELVGANPDPNNPGEMLPHNGAVAHFAHEMHGIAGNIILFAIVLHVVGAYKHHIMDKDGTLKRMLGRSVNAE